MNQHQLRYQLRHQLWQPPLRLRVAPVAQNAGNLVEMYAQLRRFRQHNQAAGQTVQRPARQVKHGQGYLTRFDHGDSNPAAVR